MSAAAQVDPHDKMRSRDVNLVARGEQAPRPPHEPGSIADAPPRPEILGDGDDQILDKLAEPGTAPNDIRFPFTNQTRHCYTRYLEYHMCIKLKGEGATECEKFQKYYRSLCPVEWIVRWNEQRALGIFPGPI